jgi:hypothetical protein
MSDFRSRRGRRNFEIVADLDRQVFIDLTVARDRRGLFRTPIHED